MTSKPRPKVQAAASGTAGVVTLAFVLRLCGVDVDEVPPEVLLAAAGGVASLCAYLKRDGLAGAWDRIVHGGDS
jgi:hypothetical protein